ncbi:MAG: hypothetical protein FWG34_09180 [Oscillospiraceae bacterium]|nr:hypothetical protein [Oscillospiraceae bacterium]
MIIGLINIQTVIAFIAGLFFVPGIGLTDDINIAYAGLEKPVAIETEYGIFSLEFAIKITQNGKTDLSLLLDSQDLPYYGWEKYDISFGLSVKNKMLELEDDKWYGAGWATAGEHHINFKYTYENFPNVNGFDLIVCGVKTRITLTNKKITDYALSEENNGITMALCKLGEDDLIYQGFFHKNFDNENYSITMINNFMDDYYFYDINGDKIQNSVENFYSFGTGFDDGYCIYKAKNDINGIVPKIKGFKSNSVYIDCSIKNPADIEIPVPKDGETIETDIEITFGQYIYKITEVWRKGDSIYFEDNGIKKRETIPKNETTPRWFDELQIYPGFPEYENAVANRESFIRNVYFVTDEATISTNRGRPILKFFSPTAETIKLTPTWAGIAQYGNFDAEFN